VLRQHHRRRRLRAAVRRHAHSSLKLMNNRRRASVDITDRPVEPPTHPRGRYPRPRPQSLRPGFARINATTPADFMVGAGERSVRRRVCHAAGNCDRGKSLTLCRSDFPPLPLPIGEASNPRLALVGGFRDPPLRELARRKNADAARVSRNVLPLARIQKDARRKKGARHVRKYEWTNCVLLELCGDDVDGRWNCVVDCQTAKLAARSKHQGLARVAV
jgi:hypothetical protein